MAIGEVEPASGIVKGKPSEIPEFLEIDVTDMAMNTNLFVKDISLPEDVEMITVEDIAVMSVQEPKEEKEEVDIDIDEEDSDGEDSNEESSDDSSSESNNELDGDNK